MSEQEVRRAKILHKYVENPHYSHSRIADELGISKSGVTLVIKRYKATGTISRKPGSGGRRFGRKDLPKKVDAALQRNPGLSLNDLASKLGSSKGNMQKVKEKLGYKTRKVQKIPNRNYKQNLSAHSRARKLYDQVMVQHKGCFILDDETYGKADFKQMPGNEHYSEREGRPVDEQYKRKKVDKFAKKYLIWQAICSCGKSSSIYVCKGTMKSDEYLRECLKKRFLKLYRDHDIPPVFWPDLATIHYSRAVLEWFKANNIVYVEKEMNPPNCPQLRNIEKYWAKLKRIVKKKSTAAKDLPTFKRKVNAAAKAIGPEGVQSLMATVKARVRLFIRGQELK